MGHGVEPETERLSEILNQFKDLFGNINWEDSDRMWNRVTTEIPENVLADDDYANARAKNDAANAKLALTAALTKAMQETLGGEIQLYKQFADNPDFKAWLIETVFRSTYGDEAA